MTTTPPTYDPAIVDRLREAAAIAGAFGGGQEAARRLTADADWVEYAARVVAAVIALRPCSNAATYEWARGKVHLSDDYDDGCFQEASSLMHHLQALAGVAS